MPTNTPLLIVTAGPGRGRTLPLERVIQIGRDVDSTLPIADPALSRRHCTIDASGAVVVIRDQASRNGVFVNGVPVSERQLTDGDQIRIGDTALLVIIPSDRAREPALSVLFDASSVTSSTIALALENSTYLSREATPHLAARAVADLHRLFAFGNALQTATTLQAVYGLVLEYASDAFAPCQVAVLSCSTGDDTLTPVRFGTNSGSALTVNQDLTGRALRDGVAVLSEEVPALAVPIRQSGAGVALLWVAGSGRRIGAEDLQLAAAMGAIASLAAERATHVEWLHDEATRLRKDAEIEHSLVGESAAIQATSRFIARVSPTDATVLLRGESGTGKELIARDIHANSARRHGPFVPINCAALPDALLESELFGHERGAFTGAVSQQRGRLELADRGTVFLDEIGELAQALQAKLLRVLQDQIVERVGGRRGIKIDIRVIAATNLDLEKAMALGTFRPDLFYRLNVVSFTVPPLRDRRDDIALLAAYFVQKHAARCKRTVRGIAPAARALLMRYDWPGNVRELSNVIERAIVLGSGDTIAPDDLPEQLLETVSGEFGDLGFHQKVVEHKREIIRAALQRHDGNVSAAARELDLQVTYLHRLIRNLNVR